MFEVLVFVYENYWRGDACPELQQLGRKLSAHGFEPEEIREALLWLDGLNFAAQNAQTRGSLALTADAFFRTSSAGPYASRSIRLSACMSRLLT